MALSSLVMKCFDSIVKGSVLDMSKNTIDPLQFAYQARNGVDDATATLLDLVAGGTEKACSSVLCWLSSAFNYMQPHILAHMLSEIPNLNFGTVLAGWHFNTEAVKNLCKWQFVWSHVEFDRFTLGLCVVSIVINTVIMTVSSNFVSRHILKFADASMTVSLLQHHEVGHGPELEMVRWLLLTSQCL